MIELFKTVVIIIGALILSLAGVVYAMYATGLTLSLLTGNLLGMESETMATLFAWAGIVLVGAVFVAIAYVVFRDYYEQARADEAAEELAQLFKELGEQEGGDD